MHFTLADLAADIAQNAAESGADTVEMEIRETASPDGRVEFRFTVKDNGKGMSRDEMERAKDPFVTDGVKHPRRKVGLGIPFLIQTASQSGGGWELHSAKNEGTAVTAWFDMNNVDTPPVGDLPGMFRTILLFPGPEDILIRRAREGGGQDIQYELRKSELAEAVGGLENAGSLALLSQYLRSMEEDDEE
ncbi:MAG: ATP-binding protein [Treponema sp.]|jgi:hypothetical protein|nr:ATP-binding protein [Treponema sp.]